MVEVAVDHCGSRFERDKRAERGREEESRAEKEFLAFSLCVCERERDRQRKLCGEEDMK